MTHTFSGPVRPVRSARAGGVALVALLVLAGGCTSTSIVLGAGAVEASGPKARRQSFAVVGFDLERSPERALPVFCVRLAAGEPALRVDELTLAHAERALARWAPPPHIGPAFYRAFPAHDVRSHDVFVGHGYWVSFREGRLVALSVGDAESAAAALPGGAPPVAGLVGPRSCERLDPLPIERARFVEIFGEPDRENEIISH